MKVTAKVQVDSVVGVICDVCGNEVCRSGSKPEFGTLSARWGYASSHDGESYQVDLCEACFFSVLGGLREKRKTSFSDNEGSGNCSNSQFGLIIP
tara:strand:+ start:388 stop:672 length:285 start_codon:yes stop_codon:yes gene_type:complete